MGRGRIGSGEYVIDGGNGFSRGLGKRERLLTGEVETINELSRELIGEVGTIDVFGCAESEV